MKSGEIKWYYLDVIKIFRNFIAYCNGDCNNFQLFTFI